MLDFIFLFGSRFSCIFPRNDSRNSFATWISVCRLLLSSFSFGSIFTYSAIFGYMNGFYLVFITSVSGKELIVVSFPGFKGSGHFFGGRHFRFLNKELFSQYMRIRQCFVDRRLCCRWYNIWLNNIIFISFHSHMIINSILFEFSRDSTTVQFYIDFFCKAEFAMLFFHAFGLILNHLSTIL